MVSSYLTIIILIRGSYTNCSVLLISFAAATRTELRNRESPLGHHPTNWPYEDNIALNAIFGELYYLFDCDWCNWPPISSYDQFFDYLHYISSNLQLLRLISVPACQPKVFSSASGQHWILRHWKPLIFHIQSSPRPQNNIQIVVNGQPVMDLWNCFINIYIQWMLVGITLKLHWDRMEEVVIAKVTTLKIKWW